MPNFSELTAFTPSLWQASRTRPTKKLRCRLPPRMVSSTAMDSGRPRARSRIGTAKTKTRRVIVAAFHDIAASLGPCRPFALKTSLAFSSGVLYQAALIGVGVSGALVVGQVIRHGEIFWPVLLLALAVVATSFLSWVELWIAHDLAYQLLAEMRIDMYQTLDPLAPGYLLGRRSGDLVSIISSDVETIEIFFAHTIAPAFVAILVPGVVLFALGFIGWPLAATLLPFPFSRGGVSTFLPETISDRLEPTYEKPWVSSMLAWSTAFRVSAR